VTSTSQKIYLKTQEFLKEHPDCESEIRTILEIDDSYRTWAFDDVPLDSGTFGELVAREIIDRSSGEYRVADREAVQAALDGEDPPGESDDSKTSMNVNLDVHYSTLGGVVGVLIVMFVARITQFSAIFQDGSVVSPANDPYLYRYWQEQLLAESSGLFSFGVLVNPIWEQNTWNQKPLTHATNWWVTELLGGDQSAAAFVAAWFPIVLSLLMAIVLYYIVLLLTDDARIGLVSVLIISLAPIHVNYTGLGLIHHRPHHLFWLGVVLLMLVWLAQNARTYRTSGNRTIRDRFRDRTTWVVTLVFGISIGLYVHSWGGSAELFVPLLGYLGLRVAMDIRAGLQPRHSTLPVIAGFGIGATVAMGLHLLLNWHGLLGPALSVVAFLGALSILGLAELWTRFSFSPRSLVYAQPIIGLGGVVVLLLVSPTLRRLTRKSFGSVLTLGTRSPATQAQSLYSTDHAVILGPLVQIGPVFFLALGVVVWSLWLVKTHYEPAWLAMVVFCLYNLVAAGLMLRFASRLVLVLAVFGGSGFVYLLSVLDLARTPAVFDQSKTEGNSHKLSISLSGQQLVSILFIGMLVFGLNLIFIPTTASDTTHDEVHLQTVDVIKEHAENLDRNHPQNRVFAPWKNYRMYNYFVNGQSREARFARMNYNDFISDPNPDSWYDEFEFKIGYVVYTDALLDVSENRSQRTLSSHLGVQNEQFESLEHFRAIHIREDDDLAVFAVVPGAVIEIESTESKKVVLKNEVTVSERTFTYERVVNVGENGTASVRVPYPGEYEINGTTVTIDTQDIEEPRVIEVEV
jgi:dolichyl-diphosphooligosaccharide--protein glycosyltransferase